MTSLDVLDSVLVFHVAPLTIFLKGMMNGAHLRVMTRILKRVGNTY